MNLPSLVLPSHQHNAHFLPYSTPSEEAPLGLSQSSAGAGLAYRWAVWGREHIFALCALGMAAFHVCHQ